MKRTPGHEEEQRRKEAGRAYFEVPLTKEESQRHISDRTPEQPPPPYAVEYVRGNLPIVLTVPHGGYISPPSIPSRRKGCLEHDDCSQELARAIYAQMVAYVNNDHDHNGDHGDKPPEPRLYPHLVVLHLNRLKVDVNRPLDGAVDDPGRDTKAVAAHTAYHGCIEEALRWSVDTWGFAHLFDIHGQSHRQVMEFGFLLSTEHLRSSDEQLDEAAQDFLSKSSLSGMERCHSSVSHRPSFCLSAVVRGQKSLGALLQAHGFDSVPSPKYPSPSQTPPFRADMPYFWGAWTTRHYAQSYQQEQDRVRRKWLAFVSTTQVEPTHAIRCDLPTRAAFAHALAQTFVEFIKLNYNCEIGTSV